MTCAATKFFIVLKTDLTKDMLTTCCGHVNVYALRESADKTKVLLKYCCAELPHELYLKGYIPFNEEDIRSYLGDKDNGFLASEVSV